MAISTSQLSEQIQRLQGGGSPLALPQDLQQGIDDALAVDTNQLRSDLGLESREQERINELRKMLTPVATQPTQQPFDFGKSFDKYSERLAPFFAQSTRPTFYDLASDIGAAMLSADPRTGAFRSAGMGFANFNERLRKDRESRMALDRQVGLQAFQMAVADEKAARDYLNSVNLENIKNSQKPYDPLIYEVPDPEGGEPKIVEVNPYNQLEVATIRATPGAKQIKLPDSQIQIDQRGSTPSQFEKDQGKELSAMLTQWREDAKAARDQTMLTNQFLAVINRLGPEGWGKLQAGTSEIRTILQELGLRDDPRLGDQALASTLGTRLSMSLIALTKGAITEMEMRLFQAASPSLAQTYEGALKQAALLQRIANLSVKKAQDYAAAASQGLLDGAETDDERLNRVTQWESEWFKKNRFLTTDEEKDLRELALKEPEAAKAFRVEFLKEQGELNTDVSDLDL